MADVKVKRNGAFCEFHLHDACLWAENITNIATHQDLAAKMASLADDFTWFRGEIMREFERIVEQRLNRF